MPVVFWLDSYRPRGAADTSKVKMYLHEHDTTAGHPDHEPGASAMRYTLERVIRGMDTISATGNILRDYLTDLFPDHGAGHPRQDAVHRAAHGRWQHVRDRRMAQRTKHVQQLVEENHLRWDSLGEFLRWQ